MPLSASWVLYKSHSTLWFWGRNKWTKKTRISYEVVFYELVFPCFFHAVPLQNRFVSQLRTWRGPTLFFCAILGDRTACTCTATTLMPKVMTSQCYAAAMHCLPFYTFLYVSKMFLSMDEMSKRDTPSRPLTPDLMRSKLLARWATRIWCFRGSHRIQKQNRNL